MVTVKEIAERTGKRERNVYAILRRFGIKPEEERYVKSGRENKMTRLYSDFVVDFVASVRNQKKARPTIDGKPRALMTTDEVAEQAGLSKGKLLRTLCFLGIETADYYHKSVAEAVRDGYRLMKGAAHCKKPEKELRREERNTLRNRFFKSSKSGYFFVSTADTLGRYIVKAVCLSYLDARMISEELNALGIKSHFRSHSFRSGGATR